MQFGSPNLERVLIQRWSCLPADKLTCIILCIMCMINACLWEQLCCGRAMAAFFVWQGASGSKLISLWERHHSMQQKTLCILSSRVPLATWQSKHFVRISSSGCLQVPALGLWASLQVGNNKDIYCLVLQSSSS